MRDGALSAEQTPTAPPAPPRLRTLREEDGTHLVQVVERRADVMRLPRGEKPTYEFHLGDHEEIVGVSHEWMTDLSNRETVDHHIIVWVRVRL